jgi:polyol permease family
MSSTVSAGGDVAAKGFLERIGIPRPLLIGYIGLALFMIGDGVESNYLVTYFVDDFGFSSALAGNTVLVYGAFVAVGSWLSGTLSTLFGPKRIMIVGAAVWVVFEVLFLSLALPRESVPLILLTYGVRGVGYPLFAFSFLTWINIAVRPENRATAGGWFWFAFTGGLPVIGTGVAVVAIPLVGQYATFWLSLVLVVVGALIAILGAREAHGTQRLVAADAKAGEELKAGISILWRYPKVGLLATARCINTGAQYGFFVALPLFLQNKDDAPGGPRFSQQAYLLFVVITFGANVVFNPIWGRFGDKLGWRKTATYAGGVGCAASTLLLYYVPLGTGTNFLVTAVIGALFGIALAGFVPLSALITTMVSPHEQGNAIAVYALAAGASTVLGPLVFTVANPLFGTQGVMLVFAALYVVSAVLVHRVRDAVDPGESTTDSQREDAATARH